jgi:hypothetical protein
MEVPANIVSPMKRGELIQSFPFRWHSFEHRAAICVLEWVLLQSENEMYKHGQHACRIISRRLIYVGMNL